MAFDGDLPNWRVIVPALLVVNAVAFAAFALDKAAARRGARRTRESTLLGLALAGGVVGALAAQRLLRHKTRKEPFRSRLYAIAAMQAAIVVVLAVIAGRPG